MRASTKTGLLSTGLATAGALTGIPGVSSILGAVGTGLGNTIWSDEPERFMKANYPELSPLARNSMGPIARPTFQTQFKDQETTGFDKFMQVASPAIGAAMPSLMGGGMKDQFSNSILGKVFNKKDAPLEETVEAEQGLAIPDWAPSHERGGVNIEVEGGEEIYNANSIYNIMSGNDLADIGRRFLQERQKIHQNTFNPGMQAQDGVTIPQDPLWQSWHGLKQKYSGDYELGAKGVGNWSEPLGKATGKDSIDCSGALCEVHQDITGWDKINTGAASIRDQFTSTFGPDEKRHGDFVYIGRQGSPNHIAQILQHPETNEWYFAESTGAPGPDEKTGVRISPYDQRLLEWEEEGFPLEYGRIDNVSDHWGSQFNPTPKTPTNMSPSESPWGRTFAQRYRQSYPLETPVEQPVSLLQPEKNRSLDSNFTFGQAPTMRNDSLLRPNIGNEPTPLKPYPFSPPTQQAQAEQSLPPAPAIAQGQPMDDVYSDTYTGEQVRRNMTSPDPLTQSPVSPTQAPVTPVSSPSGTIPTPARTQSQTPRQTPVTAAPVGEPEIPKTEEQMTTPDETDAAAGQPRSLFGTSMDSVVDSLTQKLSLQPSPFRFPQGQPFGGHGGEQRPWGGYGAYLNAPKPETVNPNEGAGETKVGGGEKKTSGGGDTDNPKSFIDLATEANQKASQLSLISNLFRGGVSLGSLLSPESPLSPDFQNTPVQAPYYRSSASMAKGDIDQNLAIGNSLLKTLPHEEKVAGGANLMGQYMAGTRDIARQEIERANANEQAAAEAANANIERKLAVDLSNYQKKIAENQFEHQRRATAMSELDKSFTNYANAKTKNDMNTAAIEMLRKMIGDGATPNDLAAMSQMFNAIFGGSFGQPQAQYQNPNLND